MNIGILTGGGDCPGLNAVIRAVVRKAEKHYGTTVFGFHDGWKGILDERYEELTIERMRGTLPRGGTILGTTRDHPYMYEGGKETVMRVCSELGIDSVIVVGGEGTLSCALRLQNDEILNVIGVPKTIDNDISATEMTFGFSTAVDIATEAIDRLHTTAESHDRIMIAEVMGRHVGHIAAWAGMAGGATMVLIPEEKFNIDSVAESLIRRHNAGRWASVVVVAEGALPEEGTMDLNEPSVDQYGHQRLGGISNVIAEEIEKRTGFETRVTVLGHVQRGGSPNPFDRVLGTRLGIAAIDAAENRQYGEMVALQNGSIVTVPLEEAVGSLKTVSTEFWEAAKNFF
ncbi:MAG: 6-phosphofructokinase [Acidimicrobiaceae bacterium]|mgnify:FL=1|nr:6-phosphofructokinase [Acidimicrobiaceae bacterium]|tara:strand:- start:1455 stop:2483 length:1029 start_codon:yes stop_codon:yes gene_type:complete